jgi:hypothetical protein
MHMLLQLWQHVSEIEPANAGEVVERDAIASALKVFGGPTFRKRILREAAVGVAAPNAPFLRRLETVAVREDPQISHDR